MIIHSILTGEKQGNQEDPNGFFRISAGDKK